LCTVTGFSVIRSATNRSPILESLRRKDRIGIGPVDQHGRDHVQHIADEEFTAKDFRTWAGTLLAVRRLHESGCTESATEAKSVIARAVEQVAKQLGNTPAICRKCYIHPSVLEAYQDPKLFALWEKALDGATEREVLSKEESALLEFLSASEK